MGGAELDYAVAVAIGIKGAKVVAPSGAVLKAYCWIPNSDGFIQNTAPPSVYDPSSCWVVGGQIIEREKITTRWREPNAVSDTGYWAAMKDADSPQPGSNFWMVGSTALIAAMRAFVTAKLGAEVDL